MSGEVHWWKNVDARVEGKELVVRINIDAAKVNVHRSASGRVMTIATTEGERRVSDTHMYLDLSLYYKR